MKNRITKGLIASLLCIIMMLSYPLSVWATYSGYGDGYNGWGEAWGGGWVCLTLVNESATDYDKSVHRDPLDPGSVQHTIVPFIITDAKTMQVYDFGNNQDMTLWATVGSKYIGHKFLEGTMHYQSYSRLMIRRLFLVNPTQNITVAVAKDDGEALQRVAVACPQYTGSDYVLKYDGEWSKSDSKIPVYFGVNAVTCILRYDNNDYNVGAGEDTTIGWGDYDLNLDQYKYRYIIFNPFSYKFQYRDWAGEYHESTISRWGCNAVTDDYNSLLSAGNITGLIGWDVTGDRGYVGRFSAEELKTYLKMPILLRDRTWQQYGRFYI